MRLMSHDWVHLISWVAFSWYFTSDRWRSLTGNEKTPLHVRASVSQTLWNHLVKTCDGDSKLALKICNTLNEPPVTFFRCNTMKRTRDQLYKALLSKHIPVSVHMIKYHWCASLFCVPKSQTGETSGVQRRSTRCRKANQRNQWRSGDSDIGDASTANWTKIFATAVMKSSQPKGP